MSTTLLVEAKREYTEQLVLFLRDAMYDDFYVLWKNSVDSPDPMMKFQETLEEIVDWDEKTMIQKTDSCISKTGCKYLDDLITAVFVAHMKILMSIKNDGTKDRYRLQVPTTNKFVYECLLQCSRELWKSPYLFYQNESENKIKKVQIQKNLRQAEEIISAAIHNTIRGMLPVKEIVGDVFEYDKDGDLILDIQKPTQKEPIVPIDNPSTEKPPHPVIVESTDLSGSLEPSITPTPDVSNESGVNISDALVSDAQPLASSPLTPDVSGEGVGVEVVKESDTVNEKGDETSILEKTIENIRVMNSSKDSKNDDFEYKPGVPSENPISGEENDEVDWNKGFVLGPVEEDLEVETEVLEPESKEEVDMDDVIELK
jgi:hypothetical protein